MTAVVTVHERAVDHESVIAIGTDCGNVVIASTTSTVIVTVTVTGIGVVTGLWTYRETYRGMGTGPA